MFDISIIGCGPAGLTAGIYASRAGLKTVLFGKPEKSEANMAASIKNYPGFPDGIAGADLVKKIYQQTKKSGADFIAEEILDIEQREGFFVLTTNKEKVFQTKSIIIATGKLLKKAGIPKEEDFIGKGISYCATCDGPLYKNQEIAVLGNGNFAANEALLLAGIAKKVTLVANHKTWDINSKRISELKAKQVELVPTTVKSFQGNKDGLTGIFLENKQVLTVAGIFIALNSATALDFANKLKLNSTTTGIKIDINCKTNTNGIFAAGDCAGGNWQIAKAVGEGCNAALSAVKYIREIPQLIK